LLVGLSDLTRTLGQQDAKYSARAIEAGAQVYYEQCARCHSADGKGIEGQGPELSGIQFLGKEENGVETQKSQRLQDIGWAGTLDGYIRAVTSSGIPLKSSNVWEVVHPAFAQSYGGNLRDDQIENVAAFIENWRQAPNTGTDLIEEPKPGEGQVAQATAVPLSPEQQAGKDVFLKQGCIACHTIKGVSTGAVGPNLSKIGADAAEIITSDGYKQTQGKATTPEDFIHESIISPNTYIATNCPTGPCAANIMPQTYGIDIPAQDLTNLVTYLASLK
jgi:mono/diheme cytochrome c family protein